MERIYTIHNAMDEKRFHTAASSPSHALKWAEILNLVPKDRGLIITISEPSQEPKEASKTTKAATKKGKSKSKG